MERVGILVAGLIRIQQRPVASKQSLDRSRRVRSRHRLSRDGRALWAVGERSATAVVPLLCGHCCRASMHTPCLCVLATQLDTRLTPTHNIQQARPPWGAACGAARQAQRQQQQGRPPCVRSFPPPSPSSSSCSCLCSPPSHHPSPGVAPAAVAAPSTSSIGTRAAGGPCLPSTRGQRRKGSQAVVWAARARRPATGTTTTRRGRAPAGSRWARRCGPRRRRSSSSSSSSSNGGRRGRGSLLLKFGGGRRLD